MTYLYGSGWFEDERKPVEPMSEEQARRVFEKGPQLGVAAVEGVGLVPRYALTMNAQAESVDVHLYDEQGSEISSLSYQTVDGRLFLFDVTEWLYPDDGHFHGVQANTAIRTFLFKPDGYARLRTKVKAAPAATIEEFTDVNVSDHWLDPLEWGDWDRIGEHRPTAV
ncbi:hypothetical protein IC607_14225 [Cellulomonas sp. JH27-2]|uniref:hypothetical protein n=1 Tax=Cellulomonas sp. JH27-2 TaxID=2774139 RepID=UPI00177B633C|nr:hypothetical protein [Cellulomonas sp. JH27-2]MBD8060126.1 hypothetical protein [Cellulomonas sp. JH27-2]